MPYLTSKDPTYESVISGSDFTGDVGKLVKVTAVETISGTPSSPVTVDLCTAITDIPYGVIIEEVTAGKVCKVQRLGECYLAVSAAAILVGAKVSTATSAKFQTAVTTQHGVGIALTATGGADEKFAVSLQHPTLTPLA